MCVVGEREGWEGGVFSSSVTGVLLNVNTYVQVLM